MSFVKILLSVPDSAETMNSAYLQLNTAENQVDVEGLQKLMGDVVDGAQLAYTKISTGAVQASSTGTFTGAATANQTMTIAGVTFTAKASPDESAEEYLVSATVALEAASLARAINASTDLAGLVTASAALGVVTITAVQPGIAGNQIPTVDIDTSNFTFAHPTLQNGSDGTEVAVNFGAAS
jgi:hypothetical protein